MGDVTATENGSAAGQDEEISGADASDSTVDAPENGGRRTVTVPQPLFRVVVVFSTVLSILTILLGFVLLDTAIRIYENPDGSIVVAAAKTLVGTVDPHVPTLALAVALLGAAFVGGGIWTYAIGTRFRASRGKPKDGSAEERDDG
ncbi:MAG: hypothetical protein V5A23_04085 [Halobacteriales archaeon]